MFAFATAIAAADVVVQQNRRSIDFVEKERQWSDVLAPAMKRPSAWVLRYADLGICIGISLAILRRF